MATSILLVDDEPLVLAALAKGLRDAGYQVTPCYNGPVALDYLRGRPFDLLITDMVMPGMSGSELIRFARTECPRLLILQTTAYQPETSGVDPTLPLLRKPFAFEALVKTITSILGNRPMPTGPTPGSHSG